MYISFFENLTNYIFNQYYVGETVENLQFLNVPNLNSNNLNKLLSFNDPFYTIVNTDTIEMEILLASWIKKYKKKKRQLLMNFCLTTYFDLNICIQKCT